MPVAGYTAELRVLDNGLGTVLWSSDFEVTCGDEKETADIIRAFLTPAWKTSRSNTDTTFTRLQPRSDG